jgi:hypothetical protein
MNYTGRGKRGDQMLARPDHVATIEGTRLLSLKDARAKLAGKDDATLGWLLDWTGTYLTKAHDGLGRRGPVCPFTPQAIRIDTIRVAVSQHSGGDGEAVERLVRTCFDELDGISCAPGLEQFRAIVLAFPNCTSPAGVEMLKRVQSRLSPLSLVRSRMIGLFHPNHDAKGAWNGEFRPLQAPVPMIVVRLLVEQDAPFAARNLRLLGLYLLKFRWAGVRRLHAYWAGSA